MLVQPLASKTREGPSSHYARDYRPTRRRVPALGLELGLGLESGLGLGSVYAYGLGLQFGLGKSKGGCIGLELGLG
jgi:hypothetical protein